MHKRVRQNDKNKITWPISIFHYLVGPWCFDYPHVYTGRANVTVGGLPCLRWDSLPPNTFKHLSEQPWGIGFRDEDIGGFENYCRNPDGDVWPWCFTGDPDVPFDFCSIEDLACHPDEKLWGEIKIDPVESSTAAERISKSSSDAASSSPQWIFQIIPVLAFYASYLKVVGMCWKYYGFSKHGPIRKMFINSCFWKTLNYFH